MTNVMFVLFAKRVFSEVIEGVHAKTFRWLRSHGQNFLSSP